MGKKAESRRFLWGMGLGGSYAFLLSAVTFLTEHHARGDMKELILLFFLCLIGGTLEECCHEKEILAWQRQLCYNTA